MITASEAKKITIENARRKEKEVEHMFEGFLEYVEKEILKESKNGQTNTRIWLETFNKKLSSKKVPKQIIKSLMDLGYAVIEDCDFRDSNIWVGWKNG